MRAVATGKLALMRGHGRRSGVGSSFARNVVDADGDDDDAEAELDEEALLATQEEARLDEGDDVVPDGDDDGAGDGEADAEYSDDLASVEGDAFDLKPAWLLDLQIGLVLKPSGRELSRPQCRPLHRACLL